MFLAKSVWRRRYLLKTSKAKFSAWYRSVGTERKRLFAKTSAGTVCTESILNIGSYP